MYKSSIFLTITVLLSFAGATHAQCTGQINNATVTITSEYCGKANGEILINNTSGGIVNPPQTLSYQLNGGTAQSSNLFANLSAGNYILSITELPSGCIYTHATTIVVANQQGFTSATETHTNITACNATDATIVVSTVGGIAPNMYQFNYDVPQNNSTIMNVGAGLHFINITDSKGCDTSVSVVIPDLNGITNANFVTYPIPCTGNTGSVKIKTITGTTPVTMQIDGGITIPYTDTIVGLAQGKHSITLIDAAGCKFTINTIYVNKQVPYNAYTINVVSDTCNRRIGQLFITNNTGGAVPATFALDESTTYTVNALFSNLTKGAYTLHIKDNNGCLKDTIINIPTTSKPQITLNVTAPSCGQSNGSIAITNIIVATPTFEYTCNGTNQFTNLPEGNYTIKITDNYGCDSSQQVILNATNKITSINALLTNITCGSKQGSINIISIAGGVPTYTYEFNGVTQATPIKAGLQQGAYSIRITDVNACTYDTVVLLTQTNPFNCALSATSTSILTGEKVSITSTATGTTNVWTGFGTENATGTSVIVTPYVTTVYMLTSSTPEGCIATCSTTVNVQPKIIPYKAFTPNDDGKNDLWEISFLSFYTNAEIYVYSRWGQLVYQKKKEDAYTPFDGKSITGGMLTSGTYFYTINLNEKSISEDANFYKGFVELIR